MTLAPRRSETANDRFKRRTSIVSARAIIAAVAVHFAIFALFPRITTADVGFLDRDIVDLLPPPAPPLPPEPEKIARPLNPVISTDADLEVKVPTTDFDAYTARDLAPPPPAGDRAAAEEVRGLTPMTVRPRLLNRAEVERALLRAYPPILRDAGIGGTPTVWFQIDVDGTVLRTELHESSNEPRLDAAALEVAHVMRFAPAMNRDQYVRVWVSVPIRFESREDTR